MPGKKLDLVYDLPDTRPETVRDFYDGWAKGYDAELIEGGYVTPTRCAEALKRVLPRGAEWALPILDYGCGTGLSGLALKAAGLASRDDGGTLDGCDPSEGMLTQARETGAYDKLWPFDPATPPGPETLRDYNSIVCAGVISQGAAPPEVLTHLWSGLAQGARMVFSFNDHTLGAPDYMAALDAIRASDHCVTEFEEDGPHIAGRGSTARVYVLRYE